MIEHLDSQLDTIEHTHMGHTLVVRRAPLRDLVSTPQAGMYGLRIVAECKELGFYHYQKRLCLSPGLIKAFEQEARRR